jgi:hypothetical protein
VFTVQVVVGPPLQVDCWQVPVELQLASLVHELPALAELSQVPRHGE